MPGTAVDILVGIADVWASRGLDAYVPGGLTSGLATRSDVFPYAVMGIIGSRRVGGSKTTSSGGREYIETTVDVTVRAMVLNGPSGVEGLVEKIKDAFAKVSLPVTVGSCFTFRFDHEMFIEEAEQVWAGTVTYVAHHERPWFVS